MLRIILEYMSIKIVNAVTWVSTYFWCYSSSLQQGYSFRLQKRTPASRLPPYSQGGINHGLTCQRAPQARTWWLYCAFMALFKRLRWAEPVQTVHWGRSIAWHTYTETSMCRCHWTVKSLSWTAQLHRCSWGGTLQSLLHQRSSLVSVSPRVRTKFCFFYLNNIPVSKKCSMWQPNHGT